MYVSLPKEKLDFILLLRPAIKTLGDWRKGHCTGWVMYRERQGKGRMDRLVQDKYKLGVYESTLLKPLLCLLHPGILIQREKKKKSERK